MEQVFSLQEGTWLPSKVIKQQTRMIYFKVTIESTKMFEILWFWTTYDELQTGVWLFCDINWRL